jgi:hypothetical protein
VISVDEPVGRSLVEGKCAAEGGAGPTRGRDHIEGRDRCEFGVPYTFVTYPGPSRIVCG